MLMFFNIYNDRTVVLLPLRRRHDYPPSSASGALVQVCKGPPSQFVGLFVYFPS